MFTRLEQVAQFAPVLPTSLLITEMMRDTDSSKAALITLRVLQARRASGDPDA